MIAINGNTYGLRKTFLAQLETLYAYEIDSDVFIPAELAEILCGFSSAVNREIALYITRSGEVANIIVGESDSVPLTDCRLRRNAKRLSGIRCVHTHPGGSGELSDVDISALKSLRFDAMAAIGIRDGRAQSIGAGFLSGVSQTASDVLLTEPASLKKIPQALWMEQIRESDRLITAGLDGETERTTEWAVLVGTDSMESLDELAHLADTAGAEVVGRVFQKKLSPDNATYIGSGKTAELAKDCQARDADLVIFDDDLTGLQQKNLETELGLRVIDRTTLVLDIFAGRAATREGKLQVELAQLRYRSSRLIGQGVILSRLAGGIGTRGPGESRLEINKRRIRERITALKRDLEQIEGQRQLRRRAREKKEIPAVALVGYTNSGKSTLLNRLTNAGVYTEDKMFATLDAVSRKVTLPGGGAFLLTDTVGFIRKLPHTLIDAFRSTLEEAVLADVLVLVSDGSADDAQQQYDVVISTLDELGATNSQRVIAVNKCDLGVIPLNCYRDAVYISAKDGQNMDGLLSAIQKALSHRQTTDRLFIPFSRYGILNELRTLGKLANEEYTDTGVSVSLTAAPEDWDKIKARYSEALLPPDAVTTAPEEDETQ
ncbi:MAG: GTPase HflX [Clostridia bacterium]|nr:GTPase HflX [Clostridia bacterium]